MRIILTGGGTGGHVSPALAIGEEILIKKPDTDMLFIGRAEGSENKAVLSAGVRLEELNVCGLTRRITIKNVKSLFLALRAYRKAKMIIRDFAPDAVIGTGGYVSWPVIKAATALGIPTVIHESNVFPGLVTRLCEASASAVLLNHDKTKELIKNKCTHVIGNPLRVAFGKQSRKQARRNLGVRDNETLIVSFGGSGGSEVMNDVIADVMKTYTSKSIDIVHLHATGRSYYQKFNDTTLIGKSKILPYIENMPEVLTAADIVICRCGALTLSEISYIGVASILIPSPNVTDNHQYINGKHLADAGAAIMIEENNLTAETLTKQIKALKEDVSYRRRLSKCIEKFANKNAGECAADIIIRLIDSRVSN